MVAAGEGEGIRVRVRLVPCQNEKNRPLRLLVVYRLDIYRARLGSSYTRGPITAQTHTISLTKRHDSHL
jgi:hypothetical protein